jgi:hypothetical protein
MVFEVQDYGVVSSVGTPPEPAQRTYWQIVRESLQEIYQKDPNLADRQAEIVRESRPGTQQKIYQTEPFTIATDLAGEGGRPPTAEEIHKYLQIKARHLDFPAKELPDLDELKTAFAREDRA